jgi:hypothetical protein
MIAGSAGPGVSFPDVGAESGVENLFYFLRE